MKKVSNWGNYPQIRAEEYAVRSTPEIKAQLTRHQSVISRGMGRCYGDASLGPVILNTTQLNHFIDFEEETGWLTCQAGVTLKEILDVFVPRGWFLPVTPGTKYITVGGAIASDVHGKNHHKDGTFSRHVAWLSLLLANGEQLRCSPTENSDLFDATCGGMGLSGLILEARFKLLPIKTAYIHQRQYQARNLDEIFKLFEANTEATYSVAWIDCLQGGNNLGRSILMLGEHAMPNQLSDKQRNNPLRIPAKPKLRVPFNFPDFTLNKYSIKAFNLAYYHKQSAVVTESVTDYDTYFYPLDFVQDWNKMYGASGFVQYQFVLPQTSSYTGLQQILEKISRAGGGSFLAVLKLFGPEEGLMSFPLKGYTLALDFPVTKGVFQFLNELDEIVHQLGGRIYLSKDARMSAKNFLKGYPNYPEFQEILSKYGADTKFKSMLSERLMPLQ